MTTAMVMLRNFSKSHIVLTVLALVALAILISLGNWQVRRLHWKEDLIARISSRIDRAPISFEKAMGLRGDGEDIEYLPVRVSGEFLNDRERYYYASSAQGPGWHVYTPLRMANGVYVFVNRGFVPDALRDPKTRPQGEFDGPVGLVGLVRNAPAEKANSFVPDNDLKKNVYYWRGLEDMARGAGFTAEDRFAPFFLDARATDIPGGWPRGGTTRIDLPNRHLEYVVTWYGLALTLVGVYVAFMVKAWRNRGQA